MEPIGKITKIQGSAIQTPLGLVPDRLTVGSPVYKNSEIKTGNNARLKIVFNDQSSVVLGEWSFIRMEQFLYQPGSPSFSSQLIDILGGVFRFQTGEIGQGNKDGLRINTPVATIGIRGTDFFGGPLEAGMPKGEIHYGFMVIDGAIEVANSHGSVLLDEREEGTFLPMAGNKAPTIPDFWDEEATGEAYQSIHFE
jgi:hypothetical protein